MGSRLFQSLEAQQGKQTTQNKNNILGLLQQSKNNNSTLAKMQQVGAIISMLKSGNADAILEELQEKNPKFKDFVTENRGKSAEEIASKYGLNLSLFKNILKNL